MPNILTLDGSRIHDITSFFDEVNRVFMADEDWALAHSLDAFDDLLHGVYGALDGEARATLVWTEFERSRAALGIPATRTWLQAKLAMPTRYDSARIERELAALDAGTGPTFFDIVLTVIAAHPNIALVPR
ncbi:MULTISPECIES: barstar family protein [Luteimonas]|uniref:Ribonuclease inhibitor n=1 Tax=Luteimonas chenhongjianii TaxID=2006110 RepID=A0A290XBU7_9GAMM|nr:MULTISPECIES: barstar family protein [Luteimonas]ATD66553.1 ribonuclease inhibitor [Luteimonas chenhongjianii]RPD85213.1 ribonuclease inhibitor [Luteimonas sp. 100069]